MSVTNLGNVVGLLKSPTPPVKTYILWFKWDNWPNLPEEGDLYIYNHDTDAWELLDTGGTGDTSYVRGSAIKVNMGALVAGNYVPNGTIQDLLDDALYPYIPPSGQSINPSGAPFEKGLIINPLNLNYSINPNGGTITLRQLLRNTTIINTPVGNSGTFGYTGGVQNSDTTANKTFHFKVGFTDNIGAPQVSDISTVLAFYAPTYFGSLILANITESNIKALSKVIRAPGNDMNRVFSPTLQRFIYAYPKAFGVLTHIYDPNGFDVLNTFTRLELSGINGFTLADSSKEDMYVYYNNDDTTQVGFQLDFIL